MIQCIVNTTRQKLARISGLRLWCMTDLRQDLDLDDLLRLVRVVGDGDRCLAGSVQPRTMGTEKKNTIIHISNING